MIPQIQKRLAEIMTVLRFQRMSTLHRIAVPLFKELQAARELGILLVVEIIDIFDISVERIEETCKANTNVPVPG
jgi:hypothetical protein